MDAKREEEMANQGEELVEENKTGHDKTSGTKEEDIDYRQPFGVYSVDSGDHVRVTVVILKLKKAFLRNKPAHGGKLAFNLYKRSFELTLSLKTKVSGTKTLQHYKCNPKLLFADILTEKPVCKVKRGKIIIKLYKVDKNQSWKTSLNKFGLDTFRKEDELDPNTGVEEDSKEENHETETGDKSGSQIPDEDDSNLITHAEVNSNDKNTTDNVKMLEETKLKIENLEETKSECKTLEKTKVD